MDLTAQGAASLAVDNAHRTESGSQGLIQEFFNVRQRFLIGLADDIELRRDAGRADRPEGRRSAGLAFRLLFPLYFIQIGCADILQLDAEVFLKGAVTGLDEAAIDAKVAERTAAKKARDFARADAIRNELAALGIVIEDGPAGSTWRRQ